MNKLLSMGLLAFVWTFFWTYPKSRAFATKIIESNSMLMEPLTHVLTSITNVSLPSIDTGMVDVLWLLLTSIVTVPIICKIPGGAPVLGFLLGGALIGPHCLGLIQNLRIVHHVAELGVVFLMFNIGLELSFERLKSMGKFVFGLGSTQVVLTLTASAVVLILMFKMTGSSAIIVAASLALSSTAVALQVLQDRGESNARYGRITFSVLLFQDLAVVALSMALTPYLAMIGSQFGTQMEIRNMKNLQPSQREVE